MTHSGHPEWLAGIPLLACLHPEERAALLGAGRLIKLGRGEALWRRGEHAEHLGVVVSGRLKLVRRLRREVIVDLSGPGDLLGEVALVCDRRYQYDVVCLRRAEVWLLPAAPLLVQLEARRGAGLALASQLATQVLRLTRRVETLGARSVEQRLARVLVGLADRFGQPFPGGTLVPLRLRREDLASLAGTRGETTIRRLSQWKRAGLLVPQPVGYLLRDLGALRDIARGR